MTHNMERPPVWRRSAAGFTLLEIALSCFIVGVIMLAIVSTMAIGREGLSSSAIITANASQGSQVVQMIMLDVSLATAITEQTATAITMTVPDRDGDGQPETIRYAWSGVAGAPLTRQYNGGTAATLADNVYQFNLTYLIKTLTP
jgi:Tfp pilus assembly protein PilV